MIYQNNIRQFYEVEVAYSRFNNLRTFSTGLPSEMRVIEQAGMTVFVDPTRPYDNRILGLNTDNEVHLETVLGEYPEPIAPYLELEPEAVSQVLSNRLVSLGYLPVLSLEYLALPLERYDAAQCPTDIHVERWGPERADDFLALLKTSGVQCSDEIWALKRQFYCTEQFRCFVAMVDEQPCAWATSFIEQGTALLANAYTQETSRGRGCQTALLHARARDAQSLGCTDLLTDVLPQSQSALNCKKLGFSTLTVRSIWERTVAG
ncbi:GNAT family N-acetyltransferase [Photobacterium sp. MCCC 1A19761]|uniref:GNAT family N-acetyltransferase n=1 Tax=Photobacterium sp. MCCC 1A19761 TaxID=3115000 RepID=UPI00307E7AA2